ncbi:MAG: hypothetical protein JKX68_09495 [Flavobacteriales bacterium]|nr:hypothetical protein [Flavobacteriales bacterium]
MNKESSFIDINEKFELVSKRFYDKLLRGYYQFIEKSRDKDFAKDYYSSLSPLVYGMPNDEFSSKLYELFNHQYKLGVSIDKIIKQAIPLREKHLKQQEEKDKERFEIAKNSKYKDSYKNLFYRLLRLPQKTKEYSPDGELLREINYKYHFNTAPLKPYFKSSNEKEKEKYLKKMFRIEMSVENSESKSIAFSSSFFDKNDTNPNAYFKFFVAYKSKTDFLYFILKEQKDIISKEKLQELLPLLSKKLFIEIPNTSSVVEQSNDTEMGVSDKINWLGTQKELGELFVELLQKGWIDEINAKKIQALFSKSNTISQIVKPSQQLIPDEQGNKKLESQYEQIYTAKYQPKFDTIRKNPKKKS